MTEECVRPSQNKDEQGAPKLLRLQCPHHPTPKETRRYSRVDPDATGLLHRETECLGSIHASVVFKTGER